jgi:YesN/AraC family two-component response regulator
LIDGLQLLLKNDPNIEVIGTALDRVKLSKLLEYQNAHVILTDIQHAQNR